MKNQLIDEVLEFMLSNNASIRASRLEKDAQIAYRDKNNSIQGFELNRTVFLYLAQHDLIVKTHDYGVNSIWEAKPDWKEIYDRNISVSVLVPQ